MGNELSSSSTVPFGRNDVGVPDVFVRGGFTYTGTNLFFRDCGLPSAIAGRAAMVLTALDVAYVE